MCVTADGLHGVQEQLLSQIRETFSAIASGMDSINEDSARAVEMRTSELADLEAQLQRACDRLAQADAQLEARRERRAQAEERVRGARAADKEFKERQQERARDVNELHNELRYSGAVGDAFDQLIGGTCVVKDQKETVDNLMRELQRFGLEPALLAALPLVLTSKSQDRKCFDLKVIDGVKDALRESKDSLQSKLNAAKEAADAVKREADAHAAASVKLNSDLDAEIGEREQAKELRRSRAAETATLKIQAENCRKLLTVRTKASEAGKASREQFSEVQDALESLVSAAYSLEDADTSAESQN